MHTYDSNWKLDGMLAFQTSNATDGLTITSILKKTNIVAKSDFASFDDIIIDAKELHFDIEKIKRNI